MCFSGLLGEASTEHEQQFPQVWAGAIRVRHLLQTETDSVPQVGTHHNHCREPDQDAKTAQEDRQGHQRQPGKGILENTQASCKY